jgi:hypothetical protein
MKKYHMAMLVGGCLLLTGCSEEPKPRSVSEFVENPIMLEAAVVRCAENRNETRYDAECVNARQAVSIVEAREERDRAHALEAQSERKRQALRRTQEAAAEARRRAAEAQRMREEAEYLAQFGELPPQEPEAGTVDGTTNVPQAVIPAPRPEQQGGGDIAPDSATAADGANQPAATMEPAADLEAVREELRKRNEENGE